MNNLKILKATVENFQSISAKQVDIAGRSMVIVGKNGSGKSSLINAIMSAVDKKYIPTEPVQVGKESGKVKVVVGGTMNNKPVEYTLNLKFEAGSNKGKIELLDADNGKIPQASTKAVIDSLFEGVGFDIMVFIKLGFTDSGSKSSAGVKKQIEVVKSLMDPESIDRLDKIDADRAKMTEDRKLVNAQVKELKTSLEHQPYSQEELAKYTDLIDTEDIQKKFSQVSDERVNTTKLRNLLMSGIEKRLILKLESLNFKSE